MLPLSHEKGRQVMQSRLAFWQVLREAMAAELSAAAGDPAQRPGAASPARSA